MRTIRHVIDTQADRYPDEVYLIAPEAGLVLTYAQVRERCEVLGRYLLALGLQKGDKVSFFAGNGFQTVRILLGAMYSGFVSAPLNLRAQLSHVSYVLDHSDTKVVFFSEEQRETLERARRGLGRHIECIEIDRDAELIAPDSDIRGHECLPEVEDDDDALLLYTSGTTGVPKGALLSHGNIVAGGQCTVLAHELTVKDRALCSLPVYHINGAVVTVVAPLLSGGSVVMPHGFSVSRFWDLISDYRCTWFSVVPTTISYLCSAGSPEAEPSGMDQVRFGRSASAPLPVSLHTAFEEKFGIPMIETMGLTETAGPVFSNPIVPSQRKVGSPGRPVGCEAKIIGKNGEELPRGVQGEIMVRGDNVMKGYWRAPEITARAVEPDGWLHTGDLGHMDEDGFVFVTGRLKEIIIKGGENIAPREIDEALYRHPAVLDAAAVGIPDEHYGEDILCGVVLKPDCTATEEQLRGHCLEHLGEFRTPGKILLLDSLPKGPSGKIQRIKLRDQLG